MDADKIGRYVPLAEQVVERGLQIGLLAQRVGAGGGKQLLRRQRRKVFGQALMEIAVARRLRLFLGRRIVQRRAAAFHAIVTDGR